MAKEMIVSVNGREKKIAIVENGRVTEFYIERGEENSGVVGNVYKGRVMRVLPGMQSAFVDIGLERDAFLYVSDFFDEEEEIERIVMEKGKKGSPEDAKREANDRIDRSRIEREKQMESVQEITEPLSEAPGDDREPREEREESTREPEPDQDKTRRGRGRGRRPEKDAPKDEAFEQQPEKQEEEPREPAFEIEYDSFGFERISDDEDTGEMFKDAYMQEAIVNQVRAIEFDMETIAEAEVGSLLSEVADDGNGFERIADDDDPPAPAKGRRKPKAAKDEEEEKAPAKRKTPAKRGPAAKGKFTKPKKSAKSGDQLEDSEASVKESEDKAEMAVRRGGRGRRRGGKPGDENGEEGNEVIEQVADAPEAEETSEKEAPPRKEAPAREEKPAEAEPEAEATTDDRGPRGRDNRDNRDTRGRRDRGPRGRNDRPSGDRPSGDRPPSDGKRYDRNDRGRDRPPQLAISDLLKEGQEILVQIAKEPIAKKGASITSHIALAGRFLLRLGGSVRLRKGGRGGDHGGGAGRREKSCLHAYPSQGRRSFTPALRREAAPEPAVCQHSLSCA